MIVEPVYEFAPASVNVPLPFFVKPPLPLMLPPNVVLVLSPPVVNRADPSETVPAPARDATVWLKPLRSSVAPPATVVADPDANAFAAPARSVPPLTVVVPP